ncbi:MAG TPA: FAD-binding oxidoreductase [Candidatus Eisenbacteria bacterium]|jgi:NAD(P)H-flavin reductase|nr:FAD-binding oxidoreductase [Candidatus Eisenbacteria bacterium]
MAEKPRFYDAKVTKIVSLTSTVKHFVLEYGPECDTTFIAGQFMMVHLEKDGKPHKKPYSIASSPSLGKKIELCIKIVEGGYVSTWFFALKEGDVIHTSMPYGVFTVREPWEDNLVFVGTGTGIAPLRGMIQNLFEKGCTKDIWLVFGNRFETDVLYHEEFEAWTKKYPKFHFIPTVSRPTPAWKGETAYVQEIVKKTFAGRTAGLDFYGCGLVPMCQQLKASLIEMNIPREKIHFEQFT